MEINNFYNRNSPLSLNKNKSTGDLFEKENQYKNCFIPDINMKQYLSENIYSTKNSDKENSNINIINQNLNLISRNENIKNDNNFSLNNINLPDDLLIEYNNRKRLDELRKKYLSNSSLRFLRKKDELKIRKEESKNNENIIPNYKNNYKKIDEYKNEMKSNNEDNLKNIILDLKIKYENLQNEFNYLLENNDKINMVNKNQKEEDIYTKYLIEENKKLKNINNKYEMIIELLISYVNETNKLFFNLEQIEYFNLKQNIWNKKTKCINELSNFLEKSKINISNNIDFKNINYKKIKIKDKNITSTKNNLDKKNSIFNSNNKRHNNNKIRYTYSTISFRNKFDINSTDTIDNNKNKTLNKIIKYKRNNSFKKKQKK
jgi:hypothetical protein